MTAYSDEVARLAALYAGMSDGELPQIAGDSASLTEPAQLAISAELQKRAVAAPGISASAENPEEMSPMDNGDLSGVVTIRQFRDLPEAIEVEGSGTYQQPHCPNCGSLDVTFEELHKPAAYVTAAVGLPMPLHRTEWKCHACGREWKDTDADTGNEP